MLRKVLLDLITKVLLNQGFFFGLLEEALGELELLQKVGAEVNSLDLVFEDTPVKVGDKGKAERS